MKKAIRLVQEDHRQGGPGAANVGPTGMAVSRVTSIGAYPSVAGGTGALPLSPMLALPSAGALSGIVIIHSDESLVAASSCASRLRSRGVTCVEQSISRIGSLPAPARGHYSENIDAVHKMKSSKAYKLSNWRVQWKFNTLPKRLQPLMEYLETEATKKSDRHCTAKEALHILKTVAAMKNCETIVVFLPDEDAIEMLMLFSDYYQLFAHVSQMSARAAQRQPSFRASGESLCPPPPPPGSHLRVIVSMSDPSLLIDNPDLHHLQAIVLSEEFLLPSLCAEVIHPVLRFGASNLDEVRSPSTSLSVTARNGVLQYCELRLERPLNPPLGG